MTIDNLTIKNRLVVKEEIILTGMHYFILWGCFVTVTCGVTSAQRF